MAQLAGVHFTTVSLALRGSPRISAATREIVLSAVRSLSYERNPILGALTARRMNVRAAKTVPSIAFLTNRPDRSSSEDYPHQIGFYDGARARADAMGYACEQVFVTRSMSKPGDLAARLDAMHAEGVIIGALEPDYGIIDLDWDRYALVKIDTRFLPLASDFVSNDQLRMTRLAHQQLVRLGYARIGMAIGLRDEAMTNDLYGGAYSIEQFRLPRERRIPPLYFGYGEHFLESASRLKAWVEKHRVDAFMSNWADPRRLAKAAGFRVPEHLACACLSIAPEYSMLAGVVPNYPLVGAKAVELLALSLKTGQRGLPRLPISTYVEGFWQDGETAPLRR